MSSISDYERTGESGLTIEHVERKAAFTRRINSNVAKFRDGAKQLTRCANRDLYVYTRADVETVLEELRRCLEEVETAFDRVEQAPARNAAWDLTIARSAREAQAHR